MECSHRTQKDLWGQWVVSSKCKVVVIPRKLSLSFTQKWSLDMPRANEFLGILRLLGRLWVWLYVLISVVPIVKAAIFKVNWKANHLTALNLLRDKRFIRPL